MAVILENTPIAEGIFRLTLSGVPRGLPGQFLQLHLPDASMLLPRPISIFAADGEQTALVYRVAGRGTKLLSTLQSGDALRVTGPLGNGFPLLAGDAVLIGGGLGIAPLHYLCAALREREPERRISVYLGYSDSVFLQDAFMQADEVITDVGGYVTDKVDFSRPAVYYACGPAPMMAAAARKAENCGAELYLSLERRMACGVGACYACSVKTKSGNRRVCKDGPVFSASEVYFDAQ